MGIVHDIKLARERDPAASGFLEILFTYPGLHAIWIHRLSHAVWKAHLRLLARLISEVARFLTNIEIHPGATIGKDVFIDHGYGLVIGETAEVGDNVTLYQGVTLGGTGKEKGKRHPTVRDNVVISADAKVLGNIEIGEGSRVGAGSVVVKPVPPHSTVVGVPGHFERCYGEEVTTADLHHEKIPDPVSDIFHYIERRIDKMDHELHRIEKESRE